MRVGVLLQRWLDVLATVLSAVREGWRVRHALIVSRPAEQFIVRRAEPNRDAIIGGADERDKDAVLAVTAAGAPVAAAVSRAARRSFVVFEIPPDKVAVRRMTIPVQAREFASGILRNQIERLSPWHPDHIVYGFDMQASADDASVLDVRVSIVSRADVEEARGDLAAIGLPVDRIVARAGDSTGGPVTLWSRLAELSPDDAANMRRRIGIGIAAMVVVSLGLSAWAIGSAQSAGADSDLVAARAKALQRQIQGQRTPQALASLAPEERIWNARETSPSVVFALEALSRALPDGAYLTELQLENATLRMIGLTADAPSLIAQLEQSGHFADVRFFAPTTRHGDGASFKFYIEAQVEPARAIAEIDK